MKKILVTGVLGQVGWELQRTLASQGKVIGIDHKELDLSDPTAIRKFVRDTAPDIIVNPGAYTAVDKAESEPQLCMAVNATAPAILAEEAKKLNALFVHYSTDYVFDGSSTKPYTESDSPNPLNLYGKSKLDGENAIREIGGHYLILRTSWVYGMRGKNFLLTMLKLANEKEHLNIVADQIGAPTWSRLIAEATAQILIRCHAPSADMDKLSGIYNLTMAGKTSWHDFASTIFQINKQKNLEAKVPTLGAILTSDYPTPAARPQNSVLSHDKLNKTFGLTMPDWKTALELCMA